MLLIGFATFALLLFAFRLFPLPQLSVVLVNRLCIPTPLCVVFFLLLDTSIEFKSRLATDWNVVFLRLGHVCQLSVAQNHVLVLICPHDERVEVWRDALRFVILGGWVHMASVSYEDSSLSISLECLLIVVVVLTAFRALLVFFPLLEVPTNELEVIGACDFFDDEWCVAH